MKKKFTLIEVLVVVAIIGILASMILPSLGRARSKAKQTTCKSQLRQISLAITMYTDDNNSHYPTHADTNGPWATIPESWLYLVNQAANIETVTVCPESLSTSWKPPGANDLSTTYNLNGAFAPDGAQSIKVIEISKPTTTVHMWEIGYNSYQAQNVAPTEGNASFPGNWDNWLVPHNRESEYNMPFVDGHVETMNFVQAQVQATELTTP